MKTYRHLSDAVLLHLAGKSDDQAFTEIYNRYWALLYRHALRLLQNDEEAKDIVQEIFTHLYHKTSQINLNTSLSSYLYTSTRNRILNQFLRDKVKRKYLMSLDDHIKRENNYADTPIREKQLAALIEQEITALPSAMRKVFELSRDNDLSYKEMAQQLGITESIVRNNLSRALKILRSKLGRLASTILLT